MDISAVTTIYDSYLTGVNVMQIAPSGSSIWIASYGKGIFQFNAATKQWINYSTENGNLENDFFYCISVSGDYIWAGSSDGLYIFTQKSQLWTKRKFSAGGQYGNWIRALYFDSTNAMLWIGRFSFLTRLDVKRQRYDDFDLTQQDDPFTNNIRVIKPDGDKYIWFGTESGIFLYDKSKDIGERSSLTFFSSKQKGFLGQGDQVCVSDLTSDDEGVWIGTEEMITNDNPKFNIGGLYSFNRKAVWTRYDMRAGLSANGIKALAKTGNLIWIGLYEYDKKNQNKIPKGLDLLDPYTGRCRAINLNDLNTRSNSVQTLYFDGDYLWIGMDKGLWRIKLTNSFAEWRITRKGH